MHISSELKMQSHKRDEREKGLTRWPLFQTCHVPRGSQVAALGQSKHVPHSQRRKKGNSKPETFGQKITYISQLLSILFLVNLMMGFVLLVLSLSLTCYLIHRGHEKITLFDLICISAFYRRPCPCLAPACQSKSESGQRCHLCPTRRTRAVGST